MSIAVAKFTMMLWLYCRNFSNKFEKLNDETFQVEPWRIGQPPNSSLIIASILSTPRDSIDVSLMQESYKRRALMIDWILFRSVGNGNERISEWRERERWIARLKREIYQREFCLVQFGERWKYPVNQLDELRDWICFSEENCLPSSGIRWFFSHFPQVNSKKFSQGSMLSSILSNKRLARTRMPSNIYLSLSLLSNKPALIQYGVKQRSSSLLTKSIDIFAKTSNLWYLTRRFASSILFNSV